MSSPAPGKGKKKRKKKGRGGAGRGQDLPTPGRHEVAGKPVDEEEVEVEGEEKPAIGARSVPEPSSSTTAEYDELPEIGPERPRENETTANEKVHVGESGKTPSSSTAVHQPQEKSKRKQQRVSGASKSSTPSPSSGTKVKEPQNAAAANTTASTVPSTATAAAEAASVPAATSSAAVKTAGVSKTTANDKQGGEKLTTKLGSSMTTNEPQNVAAANTTASTVPSTATAAAEAASVPAATSSAAFKTAGVSKTTASDKQGGEILTTKLGSSMTTNEPQNVAAANTTAPTVPSTATAAAEAARIPAATSSAAVKTAGVSKTTANDKQGGEKLTAKLGSSLTTNARQTQGNGGPHPPKRPDYGTVGRPIRLRANFFRLNISPQLSDLYHYDVEITPNKCPPSVKRDVMNEIIRKYKDTFEGHHPAFDGEKNLYSRIKLPSVELSVKLPGEDGGKDRDFKVKIQFAASVSLLELNNFLSGKQNGKVPQDAVQALDIVMREMPSFHYTPVGRSFFPFDGQGRPLGEGCEVRFGFYSSVRHSEWKAMLVNIDVSAKGFYKEQHVIDFLCEILGRYVTHQSLDDRNFRLDKHRLEKAIRGIRIQTTHAASIKRKYTVWGVSSDSAEKLQFDVEDGVTGRKFKTTVAEYFKDTYKLHLRYPHLPCLQVGQKRDRYLPLEVCTIIPCQKRHLTEQQTANMIRSTARPAPERQQDIQSWAQEMMRASSKYLNEEFKTSVSTDMVKVDGRVLPAPTLNLGPQDQPLVPRDGAWDIRNKSLHKGARIQTWALACFETSRCCNEGHLRKFCRQMASVSSGEGMIMTEEPTVVRYARDKNDVQGLFCKWEADLPELQLIMAVLPEKSKDLYSEIKRVGDNVIGIPTQCVLSKIVQQAKHQVCTNISLKINSKLGGINQVIDPSEKSPVFREPVIIFGADVTHPSPTENGIPSIAAVVASMDANATKYCARVRAQRHERSGGAQEIIIDLAVMVKELLIEFYKANRKLKPSKIVFFRDGVSEGQFDQVLVHEVRAVQEACMMLEKEYRPKITFLVVQKRHHTRLFCEDKRDASGRAQNVPAGTTVDSGITHPYEFDFYLCSHFGIQGTSRPTHYHVLYDDNAFTADSLQQLTYQLCHVYARCTRSVSMPAPAYYAHLVAFRARHHVTNGGNGRGGDTVDLEKSAKAIQVSDRMKGAMYFT